MNRQGQGRFWVCSSTESRIKSGEMNPGFTSPLCESSRSAESAYQPITAAIILLLRSSRPTTIFGFVIPIIVRVPIKSFLVWSLTHVCKKVLKLQPSSTYSNAARSIVIMTVIRWIGAAPKHVLPRLICRAFRFCGVPVLDTLSLSAMSFNEVLWHSFEVSTLVSSRYVGRLAATTFAKLGRLLDSHAHLLSALVRSPAGASTPLGFAILTQGEGTLQG